MTHSRASADRGEIARLKQENDELRQSLASVEQQHIETVGYLNRWKTAHAAIMGLLKKAQSEAGVFADQARALSDTLQEELG